MLGALWMSQGRGCSPKWSENLRTSWMRRRRFSYVCPLASVWGQELWSVPLFSIMLLCSQPGLLALSPESSSVSFVSFLEFPSSPKHVFLAYPWVCSKSKLAFMCCNCAILHRGSMTESSSAWFCSGSKKRKNTLPILPLWWLWMGKDIIALKRESFYRQKTCVSNYGYLGICFGKWK